MEADCLMATFKVLQDEVLEILGHVAPSPTSPLRTRVKFYLNRAYLDVGYRFNFEEMHAEETFPTLSGTDRYTIAATIHSIMDLRDQTNNRIMKRVDIRAYDRTTRSSGKPFRYTRWNDCLILDPKPDAVITMLVRYVRVLIELSADADVIILSRDWDYAIMLRAAEMIARTQTDLAGLAETLATRYHEYIQSRTRVATWETGDLSAQLSPRIGE